MALVLKDRVQETTTTTGTSDFTLGGAVFSYQAFSAIGNTNTTYYTAFDPSAGDWEVGIGTYSSTGPTLTRDTILASSAGGAKVTFAAGQKKRVCYLPFRTGDIPRRGGSVSSRFVNTGNRQFACCKPQRRYERIIFYVLAW